MSTPTRLANKTQWALDDWIDDCADAHRSLRCLVAWIDRQRAEAKLNVDKHRMAQLGELSQEIARLSLLLSESDRSARAARNGDYYDRHNRSGSRR